MIFKETKLKGAYIVEIEPNFDERGYFTRVWCKNEFSKLKLNTNIVQSNISYNKKKGTLRGMHYQIEPYRETKYVRCIKGSLYDVIIDIRKNSKTYGQWIGVELTEQNGTALYIPEGFAHGFQTLQDDTFMLYQVTEFYTPGAENGIRWDDPLFNIKWKYEQGLLISDKDKNWPDYIIKNGEYYE